jgi:hypothetical protein
LFGTALLRFANRFVRQQQRSEIMQCFAMLVNFFFLLTATPNPALQHLDFLGISTCREEDAQYSNRRPDLQARP